MNDKLLKIIETYTPLSQLKYFQSEVYELTEAILCNELTTNAYGDVEHVAEEIADVMVMLKQFQLWYRIKDEKIQEIMEFKINRQLRRIEGEE